MERISFLLLLLGLLATTTAGAPPPPEDSFCDPSNLARQVALFCAHDMLTTECCEPVVAAVDLRGGDAPCFCSVAAERELAVAGFNASDLLAFYTACGGRRRVRLDACEAEEAPPQPSSSLSCNPGALADQVERFCAPETLAPRCCEAVVAAVDLRGCLCRVAATEQILSSGIDVYAILDLYAACGGLRAVGRHLAGACQGKKALPPVPPIR